MRCFKAALPNSLLSVPVGLDSSTRLFSSISFTYLMRIVFLCGCLIATMSSFSHWVAGWMKTMSLGSSTGAMLVPATRNNLRFRDAKAMSSLRTVGINLLRST